MSEAETAHREGSGRVRSPVDALEAGQGDLGGRRAMGGRDWG